MNMVPGIGPSPDRMLLARLFAYGDSHRHRIGSNYQQLPVNAPIVAVHSYSKDGAMAFNKTSDPVYAPNSKGGPAADTGRYGAVPRWQGWGPPSVARPPARARRRRDDVRRATNARIHGRS